jgi:hypothetical protein
MGAKVGAPFNSEHLRDRVVQLTVVNDPNELVQALFGVSGSGLKIGGDHHMGVVEHLFNPLCWVTCTTPQTPGLKVAEIDSFQPEQRSIARIGLPGHEGQCGLARGMPAMFGAGAARLSASDGPRNQPDKTW